MLTTNSALRATTTRPVNTSIVRSMHERSRKHDEKICDLKRRSYPKGARSSELLKILRNNRLFPEFANQLFATLKSGLPALRHDQACHCAGVYRHICGEPRSDEDPVSDRSLQGIEVKSGPRPANTVALLPVTIRLFRFCGWP